jgi:transposase
MTKEVRAVTQFFDLLDAPDEDGLARLERAHEKGIVTFKTVLRWTSRFRNGKTDLDDERRPGRPRRNGELPILRTMIEAHPYLLQKKIAQTLCLHHDIMERLITEELNFRWAILKRASHLYRHSKTGKGQDFAETFWTALHTLRPCPRSRH